MASLAAGVGATASWVWLDGEWKPAVPVLALLAAGLTARWAVGRLLRPLHETVACLQQLAGGKAGAAESLARIQASGEIGQLLGDLRTLLDFQHRVLNNFGVATETMVDLAVRVINIAKSAGEKIRNQARQAESVAVIGERMSVTILDVAKNANESALAANQAAVEASQGSKVVGQTVEEIVQLAATVEKSMQTIAELGRRSQEIGRITQMIDDVADQTNLLALNAAIEAARAGEHGRGFAVVAEEVRGLSKRTAQATQEIAATIRTIQDEISQACSVLQVGMDEANRSVELVQAAGESLQRIVEAGRRVDEHIHSISLASEEHVSATDEIAENITEVHFAANKNDEAIGEVISESLMVLGFAKTTQLVAGFALGTVRGEPLESFARVALQNQFPKRFYAHLMKAHPSIPPLFERVDWGRQEAFFRTGLLMLLLYNQGEADAESALRRVAYTHGQGHLNLSRELYPLWVNCLIAALAECDPRWSGELERSWRDALAKGIHFLSAAGRSD